MTDLLELTIGALPPANTDHEEAEVMAEGVPDPSLELEVHTKHPLNNTWTLWFFKNDKRFDWETNQREVIHFDTVEDFWALHNHIEPASRLQIGCDYSLFKKGIKPMWEDPMNKEGGRWLVNLVKPNLPRNVPQNPAGTENNHSKQLDDFWTELLLLLIGEAFDQSGARDLVNGAVVNIRGKGDKVSVWMSTSSHKEAILDVGRKIRNCRALPDNVPEARFKKVDVVFENHQDTQNKNGSRAKPTYKV